MKLIQRLSAFMTAVVMMFTITDPAALGGIVNSAAKAFAVDISALMLLDVPEQPKATGAFWNETAVTVDQEHTVFSKEVNWFLDNGTGDSGLQEVSGVAGYNKTYRVQIKFTPNYGYSYPENTAVYYLGGPTGNDQKHASRKWKEGDSIVAEFKFSPNELPSTTGVEFTPSSSMNPNLTSVKITDVPCHSSQTDILAMLPQTANIFTKDPTYTIKDVEIHWLTDTQKFDFISGQYNSNEVEAQNFEVRGTIYIPADAKVSDDKDKKKYTVSASVSVLAARQLAKPTSDKPDKFESEKNFIIKLSSLDNAQIYYTVSETEDGPDPTPGRVTETNLLYKNGISIVGTVGTTKTFYIKAIAYHEDFRTSDVAKFKYTVTLSPKVYQNISSVHLLIDPPVGGEVLDTTAEQDLNSAFDNAERYGIALISSVAWTGPNVSGKADYNARYSISVELTPRNMYAFFSTPSVYVNGYAATSTTNPSGTLTITYTFPTRTEKLKLYRVVPPESVVYADNGSSIAYIGDLLPTMVDVEAPEGTLLENQYPVTWDLNTSDPWYDPKRAAQQEFTITGTVSLPEFITFNKDENKVKVHVCVGQAGALAWPTASPSDSSQEGGHMFYEDLYVTLTAAENATIYYTIGKNEEAETPTKTGGKKYTSPILLVGEPGDIVTYYIKAIATAPGKSDSPVNSFVYSIRLPKKTVAAPTANYPTGTYQQSLNIALNCTTVGSEIYYTTDPTASLSDFKRYEGAFVLTGIPNGTKIYTVKLYAVHPDGKMLSSEVVTYTYTIKLPKNRALAPYTNYTPGESYDKTLLLTLKCDSPDTEIYYTLNGSDPTEAGKGIRYSNGKTITLAKRGDSVTVYTVKTYAKSTNPNVDDSPVVTYTFTIGVDYGVKKIEIVARPLKYSYFLGEQLNVSGGKIKVTYDDGTDEIILMDEGMIDNFDNWVIGQQTLIVYYGGETDSFNIVVRKRSSSNDDDDDDDDDKKDDDKKDDNKDDEKPEDPVDDKDKVSDPTMKGSAVKGWTQLQRKIAAAEKGSRVIIYLNGTTSVPADIINTAAKRKITIEFVVNDSISWVVDTGTLKKTVSSVSVGIKTRDVYIPSVLIDSEGGSEVFRIHTYGANKVGAVLYVKTGSKVKNRYLNLFRYNDDRRLLDFVDTSKVSSSTGVAQVVPKAGGEYVLLLDNQTKLPGDADNSTSVDARDASTILKAIVGSAGTEDSWDFNGDGLVNAIDASDILKSVVGLR